MKNITELVTFSPKLSQIPVECVEPCISYLIYQYYAQHFPAEVAASLTTKYIDQVEQRFCPNESLVSLRTFTFNPVIYKLVPVEPTQGMRQAGERERKGSPTNMNPWHVWNAMIYAVPDTLPGVIEHSGEPAAFRIPKSGINNGNHYVDDLAGEEERFKHMWEPLFTHPAPAQPVGPTIWPEWANFAVFEGGRIIFHEAPPKIIAGTAVPSGGKWGSAVSTNVIDRPSYAAAPVSDQNLSALVIEARRQIAAQLPEDEPDYAPDWVCELLIKIGLEAK